jgi:RimJ/RimL family protein N-acetyltransferase
MSEVETARLLLRRWQDDDLERLVALYGDPRVARFLSVDGHPWPRERSVAAFEHFRREWQEHGFGPWAAIDKHTGRWLGQVGLNELPRWPGPDKIEVGWDLHRWFTGRPRPARPAPLDRIGQRRPGQGTQPGTGGDQGRV